MIRRGDASIIIIIIIIRTFFRLRGLINRYDITSDTVERGLFELF